MRTSGILRYFLMTADVAMVVMQVPVNDMDRRRPAYRMRCILRRRKPKREVAALRRRVPCGSLGANFADTATELASEEVAKRHAIGVANRCRDFLHVVARRPQQMHGALDAQILEV